MKVLAFIDILLVNNIICEDNLNNQFYSNWPNGKYNSIYNPQPQYTPQDQRNPQQVFNFNKQQKVTPLQQALKQPIEANNSDYVRFNPQDPDQHPSDTSNSGHTPSNLQNPKQQPSAIGPPFSLEKIAQVAERASQLQLEESGYAMTDTEKQEITDELILAQDYYMSGALDNEGGMYEYNRLFGFGNPLLGAGLSLAGATLKGLSSERDGGYGMGSMMGIGGSSSGSPFSYLGKALAPHVSNKLKGERSSPGEVLDSFFSVAKFFNSILGGRS